MAGGTTDAEPDIEELLTSACQLLEELGPQGDDGSLFELGQMAEYHSTTQGGWVPCQVVDIQDGKIKIDLKDGYYFSLKDQQTRFRERVLAEPFKAGTTVEYNSVTQGQWVQCEVVEMREVDRAIMIDIKMDYWFSLQQQAKWFRSPIMKPYEVGTELEYWSQTQQAWIPCNVTQRRDKDDAIMIDVKEGYWFTLCDQQSKFRWPCTCLYKKGEMVEYHSKTMGKWVVCRVLDVDEDGDMQVNVKKDYWFDLEEQRTLFRPFDRDGEVHAGWLNKRGPMLGFEWRRRWCVLRVHCFEDYRDESCDELMDSVPFSQYTWAASFADSEAPGEAVKHRSDKPFGFVLDGNCYAGRNRKLDYFDAGNDDNLSAWLEKIEQAADLKREFLGGCSTYVGRRVAECALDVWDDEAEEGEEQ